MKGISLLGMAGSGKSTIGKILANTLGFAYISTGELARTMSSTDWQVQGTLAPEQAMRSLFIAEVNKYASQRCRGIIIDGMPRIADQVNFLCDIFDEMHFAEIMVKDTTAIERLSSRNRSDDTISAIAKRLEIYNNNICSIESAIIDNMRLNRVLTYETYSNEDNVDTRLLQEAIIKDIYNEEESLNGNCENC